MEETTTTISSSNELTQRMESVSLTPIDPPAEKESKPSRYRAHHKPVTASSPETLPELFSDEIIVAALQGETHFYTAALPLSCGLLLKLRAAFQRAHRRSECRFARRPLNEHPRHFYEVVRSFLRDERQLLDEPCWSLTPGVWATRTQRDHTTEHTATEHTEHTEHTGCERLWRVAEELTLKCINLHVSLQRELTQHPLLPLHPQTQQMQFHAHFLERVKAYHDTVRRPPGTFSLSAEDAARMQRLSGFARETCALCAGNRHLYCGPCGGRRMSLAEAEKLLPARVTLPFDVLLLLHHQESLTRCTGIHTGALCAEGSASYVVWHKEPAQWESIVESLDPLRDVLLFPYPDATPAEIFPWSKCEYVAPAVSEEDRSDCSEKKDDDRAWCVEICNSDLSHNKSGRWRLVVLEGSWNYAKTMALQIVEHRAKRGLPPVPAVTLTNVTGQYWRFQAEGHAAVSTIEAIAHTARAAGLEDARAKDLLTLFELQKFRVLSKEERQPRAIAVEGVGLGDWKKVHAVPDVVTTEENS